MRQACAELASPHIGGQSIADLDAMSVDDLLDWRELLVGVHNEMQGGDDED